MKNIDNTNAVIAIKNHQTFGDHEEDVEIVSEGRFYEKNGKYFFLYNEYSDIGDVTVLVHIGSDYVIMKRSGACSARMEYREGLYREILYRLPFGELVLELDTEKLDISFSEKGGTAKLYYRLKVNGDEYYNEMTVTIKPDA